MILRPMASKSPWVEVMTSYFKKLVQALVFPYHGYNKKHYFCLAYDDTWINRKSWFNRYGRKNGFICYLMRYFLQLNWRRNLHISENEYLALMALVFGRPDAHFFQKLAIRPTTRCITIGNWFQVNYVHQDCFLPFLEWVLGPIGLGNLLA